MRIRTRKKYSNPRSLDALAPPSDYDQAYTLAEFCARHRLTRSFYYKLRLKGLGPREIKLNSKILITREAAADWRRAREAATANAA